MPIAQDGSLIAARFMIHCRTWRRGNAYVKGFIRALEIPYDVAGFELEFPAASVADKYLPMPEDAFRSAMQYAGR